MAISEVHTSGIATLAIPMKPAESSLAMTSTAWRILTTPPLSGAENMAFDRATIETVAAGGAPTLRFFRFRESTVTYGRLQKLEVVRARIPTGWPAVQRPTGGGIVFHKNDLCLSLCWRDGQGPLPSRMGDQYRWIHSVILEALRPLSLRMAACEDCLIEKAPFAMRECFTQPVGYDLLSQNQKVVGGALCRQKNAFLYQGSIQGLADFPPEERLLATFRNFLTTSSAPVLA